MKRSPMSRGTVELKRGAPLKAKKPMARSTTQLAKASKPIAKVGARATRMRQGKIPPNAAEAAWMAAASQFCIVCWLQNGMRIRAEIHHLKAGDRRIGHLHSIGLCQPHHRGGSDHGQFISRHPWKTRFELAYGTELYLLEQQRALIGHKDLAP